MTRLPNEVHFSTPPRKLRFRTEHGQQNRLEEIFDEEVKRNNTPGSGSGINNANTKQSQESKDKNKNERTPSFIDFFKVEMTRGYILEHDEERYSARRQKIYSFMRIPREVERFIVYGIMQCADSFLYIHTFLPVRFILALWGLLTRPIMNCLGFRRRTQRLLTPAEICDLLKGAIWLACSFLMLSVDTNRLYHLIKSQSIIKLYIFYNMLEVGDRLLSAFGQDTIDALFWTATEPKNSNRNHSGLLPHILLSLIYVILHSFSIMFQATTLNVAVNSNNKSLLTIMISNNFVELKGSVFKKFDKNNLFQLSCCDVRERFHLSVLLFIVVIQTMKEFDWSPVQFCVMLPDCFFVLITEMFIDWLKHAFITRFNELPESLYREYTTSLAYDMTQTRQKHAFSDHSDMVARRMGFIPFPLSVVLVKAIYTAVSFDNLASLVLIVLAYAFAFGLRICFTICALGKACKLMKEHQEEKSNSTPNSMTNVPPIGATNNINSTNGLAGCSMPGVTPLINSPTIRSVRSDTFIPPSHSASVNSLPRSVNSEPMFDKGLSMSYSSTPKHSMSSSMRNSSNEELDVTKSLELGATALFSNSDVDLDDVCLNEKVLENSTINSTGFVDEEMARSEPDLFQPQLLSNSGETYRKNNSSGPIERPNRLHKRTHRRSESEPGIQTITANDSGELQT